MSPKQIVGGHGEVYGCVTYLYQVPDSEATQRRDLLQVSSIGYDL